MKIETITPARRFGRNAPCERAMTALVEIVVVTCGCGHLPLNSHRTSAAAWQFAAAHVALNPTLCKPQMGRDRVPAALAPSA